MSRALCITRKVEADFGPMYIHPDLDAERRPVGGSISTPRKEPRAQITRPVETLSLALDDALRGGALARELK